MVSHMPPDQVSAKSEPNTLERPDSAKTEETGAHNSFIRELANSVVFAAVEQPALGVAQFISNDAMVSVKNGFSKVGIEAPEHAKFNSANWYAQTFGSAVGMILPFVLTKKGLGKIGAFGEAAAVETSTLSRQAAIGMSIKESAITGAAYGTLFTPSDQSARNAGWVSFLGDRAVSGAGSALTFATLTAGSLGVGRLAETSVASRFGLAPVLRSPISSGTLGGLPGGAIAAEYDAVARHRRAATVEELTESMFAMAVVGGSFGAASYLGRLRSGTDNLRVNTGEQQKPYEQGVGRDVTANVVALNTVPVEPGRVLIASETRTGTVSNESRPGTSTNETRVGAAAELVPPTSINPNEFRKGANVDQSVRVELTPQEQNLWRQTQQAKTIEEWRNVAEQIEELPTDKRVWFNETLDRQGINLTNAELNSLWPKLLQEDPHQGYRIAKVIGQERATQLWQQQLESVQKSENPVLAEQLAKTMVFLEPSKQLEALESMLKLENPPSYLDMTSVTFAKENQLAAAKLLERKGITPQIETGAVAPAVWADWALTLEPGKIRDGLLDQVRRKISGSSKNPAEELNAVFKIAQERVGAKEYELFNSMLTGITPKYGSAEIAAVRSAALKDVDAKFISRMSFFERDWPMSDQIAARNPELIRALASNSKFNPNLERSAYLAELMSRKPPATAEQLTQSLLESNRKSEENRQYSLLSPGDVKALVEHGVKVEPGQVPELLRSIQSDVLRSFDLHGEKPIHYGRFLNALSLANEIGKNNPDAFRQQFKEPIETALGSSDYRYSRRLEVSKALGELQRAGFEGAQAIRMPELRMGKIVEMTPEAQTQMRTSVEQALGNVQALRKMLGDGPLGRLMPSVFGHSGEGGIVGRKQHQAHDFSLDNHLLGVVERVKMDPQFKDLLPSDKVNVLWAALLHDVGKTENMVDFDHNRTSISTAWGVLRSLGYSDTRIQRITDVMSKDAELSYNPNIKNSETLKNPKVLDDVVNNYRNADALNMVAILNRADIKSVKANEAWYTREVDAELTQIHNIARPRVDALNRHLLPLLPTKIPQGYGGHVMSDYSVFGHSPRDMAGQFLKQRSTIESPEYSMSFSVFTPENHRVYENGSKVIALVTGPFEHIAQANRNNLSTGNSVGWEGHVELVQRWSTDSKASAFAAEAEAKLAEIGIPAARNVAAENFPRLNHLRRVAGQFDTLTDLITAAGETDPYVLASKALHRMMTTERDGSPLRTNNEGKMNNASLSGIGLLRNGNQPIYFEGLSQAELAKLWRGNIPDFVSSGPANKAPANALLVTADVAASAKEHNLPIVILNDRSVAAN